jgi:hypothetical protein
MRAVGTHVPKRMVRRQAMREPGWLLTAVSPRDREGICRVGLRPTKAPESSRRSGAAKLDCRILVSYRES